MKNIFLFFTCLFIFSCSTNQKLANPDTLTTTNEQQPSLMVENLDAIAFANTIKAEDLSKHLHILASDEYEGRETGRKGQKMAADYLRKQFISCGISPGNKDDYYQRFKVVEKNPNRTEFKVGKSNFTYFEDYYFYPSILPDTLYRLKAKEIINLRYGILDSNYSDYNKDEIKNKVVLIHGGFPEEAKISQSKWTLMNRYKEAVKHGASFVVLYSTDYENAKLAVEHAVTSSTMQLAGQSKDITRSYTPFIVVNDKVFETISKGGDLDFLLNTEDKGQELMTENVVGFIEGTDKKDEIIILTAHYDHIGIDKDKNEVYNGADDDGTGTVTLIEIAEAFALAKKAGKGPRRSILIMPVSGEEKGLLGSQYYSENPIFPLEKTIVDLNIDMIGRINDAHIGDSNYVYLIGSDKLSKDLHTLSESVNSTYTQLKLDYTFNDEKDPNRFYYRSDHYNFAKNGIPVIFYFSGVHEDYHKPTDTVDKIIFSKVEKTARLVFFTAWEIANRETSLELNTK